jgi:putative hydrolase of the HAD superfamily
MIHAIIFDFNGVLVQSGQTVPEFIALMNRLRKGGVRVFILSNMSQSGASHIRIQYEEVIAAADKAYFSGEIGYYKPQPEAFAAILEDNRLEPNECIFVDDGEENVEAGARKGMVSIFHQETAKTIQEILSHFHGKF